MFLYFINVFVATITILTKIINQYILRAFQNFSNFLSQSLDRYKQKKNWTRFKNDYNFNENFYFKWIQLSFFTQFQES